MATTSIWRISKGSLFNVLKYVSNDLKTTPNPPGSNLPDTLSEVIGLAFVEPNASKFAHDESLGIARSFVSGVNCHPDTALAQMNTIKQKYDKRGGVIAYHGYQSFAPGEVDPATAHEIGVKLAERVWGPRFQVVVATHLDKASHIHNHFVRAPIRGKVNPE